MSKNLKPLRDGLLVKRTEKESTTASGLIIPDTAKEKPVEGSVIAIGEGARNANGEIIPMIVKVGDQVLFGKWSGTEVKLDDVDYIIMKESDVLGIIG